MAPKLPSYRQLEVTLDLIMRKFCKRDVKRDINGNLIVGSNFFIQDTAVFISTHSKWVVFSNNFSFRKTNNIMYSPQLSSIQPPSP